MKARYPKRSPAKIADPSYPRGDNQQKSNRECNERRTEAGSFCVRIVWLVMMKPMKASAHRITVEDKSVHQIFQQRPGRDACQDQMEAIHSSQVHENQDGKWYGDESPKCRIRRITSADRLVMIAVRLIGSPRRR